MTISQEWLQLEQSRNSTSITHHLEDHRSGPSPSTSVCSQQEALAAVWEFFWNNNTQLTEGEEMTSQETRRRSHSTTPTMTTPQYSPVEDSDTNQPIWHNKKHWALDITWTCPMVVYTDMESAKAQVNNVGMVSPTVVGWAVFIACDLVWPSQLAIRREKLFQDSPIHPNCPNERLNPDSAWWLLRCYD